MGVAGIAALPGLSIGHSPGARPQHGHKGWIEASVYATENQEPAPPSFSQTFPHTLVRAIRRGGVMSGRVLALVGSIAVGAALFMSGARVGMPNSAGAADDCLTAPNASAPQGSHWYYRTDRTNQRKCWYYRAPGEPAQDATAQATPEAAPAAQSHSTPAPVSSTPPTSSPGATPPVWPQVAQPAPSTRETSPPQTSTSSQINAPEPAAGRPVTWPDPPPTVGTIKAQESTTTPADARANTVHSKEDALASDDAESTARDDVPTANTWMARFLKLEPKVFLIFALGLAMVGTLFGILIKMAAVRRRRLISKEPASNQVDKATARTSGAAIKRNIAPSTDKRTNRPNRAQVAPSASYSEPTTTESVKTSTASSKRTTRPKVTAPVSVSELTTTSDPDDGLDENKLRKGDDTLAQLNQGLNDLLRAHGST